MLNTSLFPTFNTNFQVRRPAGQCWTQAVRRTQAPISTQAERRQLHQGWQDFAGKPKVAVLDDFTVRNAHTHGDEMALALRKSGADVLSINVAQGGSRQNNIARGLQDVIARLDRGERIDAVNLSQQAFTGGADAERIRLSIEEIQTRFGVPVVVAAGNSGPDKANKLARSAALVAQNATPGTDKLSAKAGPGNILQEADSTSMATALVAARAARLHSRGWGMADIVAGLRQQARREGGALN